MPKDTSPFTPGSPVPVDLFVGRGTQIEELRRYVELAVAGRQENIFLTGDRGIGKSSFAAFVSELVSKKLNALGVHVFLGGVDSLDDMVEHVFDQILKETHRQSWFEKIEGMFGQHVQQVGLFGVSVKFTPPPSALPSLVRNFPEAIGNIVAKISDERAGLFLILDDINGLAESAEFANWYKSFVDQVATQFGPYPVAVMLIGLPEKRDSLAAAQPSLMRIFRVAHIDRLSDEEVSEFIEQAFNGAGIVVEPQALHFMVMFASGLPILMHEIGDAVFWEDEDGIIDDKDTWAGLFAAAQNVGNKYLDPTVYRALRSPRYLSILGKIAGPYGIKRSEVMAKLDIDERGVFDNLLRKLRELNVIEPDPDGPRGAYRFVNQIYPLYISMASSTQPPPA